MTTRKEEVEKAVAALEVGLRRNFRLLEAVARVNATVAMTSDSVSTGVIVELHQQAIDRLVVGYYRGMI
jgi:hypothetical protein